MAINKTLESKWRYHFSILLFGASGVLIKLIQLPALTIVVGRFFISALTLLVFFIVRRKLRHVWRIDKKSLLYMLLGGLLLALHGWAFISSIQWSSVAVGTITFACFPVFSLIFEKIFFRKSSEIRPYMIISAVIVLLGAVVLVPEFSFGSINTRGVLIGLVSALAFALLLILNNKIRIAITAKNSKAKEIGIVTTFYEHLFTALILLPITLIMEPLGGLPLQMKDAVLLIILGMIVTAVGFSMYYSALRFHNPTTISIASSLEAVYGIGFALLIMRTIPEIREIVGGIIITAAVAFNEFCKRRGNIAASRAQRD